METYRFELTAGETTVLMGLTHLGLNAFRGEAVDMETVIKLTLLPEASFASLSEKLGDMAAEHEA